MLAALATVADVGSKAVVKAAGALSKRDRKPLHTAWVRALGPPTRARKRDVFPGSDARRRVAKILVDATVNPYLLIRTAQEQSKSECQPHPPANLQERVDDLQKQFHEVQSFSFQRHLAPVVALAAANGQWDSKNKDDWRAILDEWGFGVGKNDLMDWADLASVKFLDEVRLDQRLAPYVVAIDTPIIHSATLVELRSRTVIAESIHSLLRTGRLVGQALIGLLAVAVLAAGLDLADVVEVTGELAEAFARITD